MPDHSNESRLIEVRKASAKGLLRRPDDRAHPLDEGPAIGLDEVLRALWRRKLILIGTVLVVTIAAAFVIFQLTPKYTARTTVMIDPNQQQIVDIQAVVTGLSGDPFTVESQVEVITARSVAQKVIDEIGLASLPEFNAELRSDEGTIKGFIKSMIPEAVIAWIRPEPPPEAEDARRERVMAEVMRAFYSRLQVTPVGRSRVVAIEFTSEDPALAARVANEVADAYIIQQLEAQFDATEQATTWLNDRLETLRAATLASEKAVADFRNRSLSGNGGPPELLDEQITQLSQQLLDAQARYNEAQSRYANIQRLVEIGGPRAAFNTFESAFTAALREQEATLRQRQAELSSEYGPRHPVMINLNAELNSIEQQISTEVNNYLAAVQGDMRVAEEQVRSLRQSLAELQSARARANEAGIQLGALEREAQANRTLFETFLNRFKEAEQISLAQPDAWVISRAGTPTTPSFPKTNLLLLLSSGLGLLLGLGLVVAAEMLEAGLRSTEEVEKVLGVPGLGLVPAVPRGRLGRRPEDYVMDRPFSAYAESLRALYTNLLMIQQREGIGNSVLVTSAIPSEGKSVLLASLARVVASGGRRVLVIDCDLRRPQINVLFDLPNEIGLASYLAGRASADQILHRSDPSGAHVITSGPMPANAQEVLRSARMDQFLAQMRVEYDLILIDGPPVMAVSDPKVLAGISDQCLFVARWRQTRRAAVRHALKQMMDTDVHVAGVVLTQVNIRRNAMYGFGDSGYYYGKYGAYYVN